MEQSRKSNLLSIVGLVAAVPGREQSRCEGGRDMGGAGEGEQEGGGKGLDIPGEGVEEGGGRGLRATTGVAEKVSGGNHTWGGI